MYLQLFFAEKDEIKRWLKEMENTFWNNINKNVIQFYLINNGNCLQSVYFTAPADWASVCVCV